MFGNVPIVLKIIFFHCFFTPIMLYLGGNNETENWEHKRKHHGKKSPLKAHGKSLKAGRETWWILVFEIGRASCRERVSSPV